jgi:hypothetical protein
MAIKSADVRVSTMDSLVAYLVTVLNRTEDVPIRRIFNVIDVRHMYYSYGYLTISCSASIAESNQLLAAVMHRHP